MAYDLFRRVLTQGDSARSRRLSFEGRTVGVVEGVLLDRISEVAPVLDRRARGLSAASVVVLGGDPQTFTRNIQVLDERIVVTTWLEDPRPPCEEFEVTSVYVEAPSGGVLCRSDCRVVVAKRVPFWLEGAAREELRNRLQQFSGVAGPALGGSANARAR